MNKDDLKKRTKDFSLRVIKLVKALPKNYINLEIGKQLLRSGTSTAANYRAACLGKSRKDFISKIGIVIEEADESAFWMEIIIDSNVLKKELVNPLLNEANELTAIMVATRKSAIINNKL